MEKGLHVRIDAGLHQRLKLLSVRTDRPMAALVAEAVEQLLSRMEATHG